MSLLRMPIARRLSSRLSCFSFSRSFSIASLSCWTLTRLFMACTVSRCNWISSDKPSSLTGFFSPINQQNWTYIRLSYYVHIMYIIIQLFTSKSAPSKMVEVTRACVSHIYRLTHIDMDKSMLRHHIQKRMIKGAYFTIYYVNVNIWHISFCFSWKCNTQV